MVVIYDSEGHCLHNLKKFAERRGDEKLLEILKEMDNMYDKVLDPLEEKYFGSYTADGRPATLVTALFEAQKAV